MISGLKYLRKRLSFFHKADYVYHKSREEVYENVVEIIGEEKLRELYKEAYRVYCESMEKGND